MSDAFQSGDYGFSAAIRTKELLFCSGQVGIAVDGSIPQDAAHQYALAFEALGKLLAAEGCSVSDIVDLTTFHTQFPNHMNIFMKEKSRFLGKALPAWTAVGVEALGYPETLVEIKAIAKIPT
ncbi:MAG: RidA family protein [Sphingorhabdus sp.]